jgi:hypothetical protein
MYGGHPPIMMSPIAHTLLSAARYSHGRSLRPWEDVIAACRELWPVLDPDSRSYLLALMSTQIPRDLRRMIDYEPPAGKQELEAELAAYLALFEWCQVQPAAQESLADRVDLMRQRADQEASELGLALHRMGQAQAARRETERKARLELALCMVVLSESPYLNLYVSEDVKDAAYAKACKDLQEFNVTRTCREDLAALITRYAKGE